MAKPIRLEHVENQGTFSRIKVALFFFIAALILSIVAHTVKNFPSWFTELTLPLLAAVTVHLIDRWWVYKELRESLNALIQATAWKQADALDDSLRTLTEGFTSTVAEHTRVLADKSTGLIDQSLKKIEVAIENTIARQMRSLDAMQRSGIERIYPSRKEAAADIYGDLIRKNTTTVRISGISLNDFAHAQEPALAQAWRAICDYISSGRPSVGEPLQLDIKVLIVDPNCFGATLRSQGEIRKGHVLPGRLESDVRDIANMMDDLQKMAETRHSATHVTFECRLYRLPPMLFLFLTDAACYVEQYHFWSERRGGTPIPVIKYRNIEESAGQPSEMYPMHEEMGAHFDWIWDHASVKLPAYKEQVALGFENGMYKSRASNVYTDPEVTLNRMLFLLENAKQEVAIQGVSLRSFCETGSLWLALKKLVEEGKVTIRMLFIDPCCEQAKIRSYREYRIRHPQTSWQQYKTNELLHKDSDLYTHTDRAIRTLAMEIKAVVAVPPRTEKWDLTLKAKRYKSAPHCFIFRVDDSVLVEQYHYGKHFVPGPGAPAILGKDMPVIEFNSAPPDSELFPQIDNRSPFRLLSDHFGFAWELAEEIDLLALADEELRTNEAE